MLKFDRLHAEDRIELAIEALRVMFDAKCHTIKQVIEKRGCTPRELWREICAERGYDECEPWNGWPAAPPRDFLNGAPGADRALPPHWQRLLDFWKTTLPHVIGRQ